MSSLNNNRRSLPITTSVLGVIAAIAVAVAGFTGFPPMVASAARANAVMLGVDESTAVIIGPEVPIDDKFEAATATATAGVERHARLMTPVKKRTAKVGKTASSATPGAAKAKPAPRDLPKKAQKPKNAEKPKAEKPRKESKAKKKADKPKKKATAKKSKSKRGWKKARVSWYGPGFYGKGMAGGGKLKRNSMVLAHRTLAFGTKVKVSYKGRSVTAVVRDRGPFVRGRVFDLGPGTAKALHFRGVGTVKYKVLR